MKHYCRCVTLTWSLLRISTTLPSLKRYTACMNSCVTCTDSRGYRMR